MHLRKCNHCKVIYKDKNSVLTSLEKTLIRRDIAGGGSLAETYAGPVTNEMVENLEGDGFVFCPNCHSNDTRELSQEEWMEETQRGTKEIKTKSGRAKKLRTTEESGTGIIKFRLILSVLFVVAALAFVLYLDANIVQF